MIAYVGQTSDRLFLRQLRAAGIGECTQRGEMPPKRTPWFYDNGAFADYCAGRAFQVSQFMRDLRKITYWDHVAKPAFLVLPDRVAEGRASLAFSLEWLDLAQPTGVPLYLAVQNGVTPADVAPHLPCVAGLLIGGTLAWKRATTADWVAWAHAHGRRVHLGRVGTLRRLAWARSIGVDSVDSSLPLWTRDRLTAFVRALGAPRQPTLFAATGRRGRFPALEVQAGARTT